VESLNTLRDKIMLFLNGFSIAPTYIQAGAIVVLLFLLVVSLAQFRHHFVKWSMKGGLIGLFFGFVLTLLLEGFLLVGGHTVLTSTLSWNNPPKPFSTALDKGREKLTNVLGVKVEDITSKDVINTMQSLPPSEINKIKAIICTP
jgi:hypothetical protein